MSAKGKKVAETILKLRRGAIDLAKRINSDATEHKMSWILSEVTQPYNDCLEAMKRGGLITDYYLTSDKVEK